DHAQKPDPSRQEVPVATPEKKHRFIGTRLPKNNVRRPGDLEWARDDRSTELYGNSRTIVPSTTRTGYVSTGSVAGSEIGRPVESSNCEPCLGQTTQQRSASQSPSQSGPSSCEQRSSIAYSSPPQL